MAQAKKQLGQRECPTLAAWKTLSYHRAIISCVNRVNLGQKDAEMKCSDRIATFDLVQSLSSIPICQDSICMTPVAFSVLKCQGQTNSCGISVSW